MCILEESRDTSIKFSSTEVHREGYISFSHWMEINVNSSQLNSYERKNASKKQQNYPLKFKVNYSFFAFKNNSKLIQIIELHKCYFGR